MKDNFSSSSDKYARYRPVYPKELFDYINSLLSSHQNAWDCGTGNGQVAGELASSFENVYGTDISQSQIDNAVKKNNIHYSVQPAEKTDFQDDFFNLIIVAQAVHWFDFDKFYAEVKRTSRKDSILAVIGYGRIEVSKEIDPLVEDFYTNVIGKYWDTERKYIDENYQTIPFPFEEIKAPSLAIQLYWKIEHLVGYLNTWSAVKHFVKQNGFNPVDTLEQEVRQCWNENEIKEIRFPLFSRIGKVK